MTIDPELGRFATSDLERMLGDPSLDPSRKKRVEIELTRRYQEQFSGGGDGQFNAGGPQYAPQEPGSPPGGGEQRWANPPPGHSSWQDRPAVEPPTPAPKKRSKMSTSLVALAIVAVVVGGAVYLLQDKKPATPAPNQPTGPSYSAQCSTPEGYCTLNTSAPIGTSCYCVDTNFQTHYGSVQ